jgi:hypothetical protein
MVVIEESDDFKAIVTPDLRLGFRWSGDRWAHAIDLRPGPWQTVATSVEGEESDGPGPSRPAYQQLHLQRDGGAAVALAVGQSGDHHYAASFRVEYRAWRPPHDDPHDRSVAQDRFRSVVTIDVADRCRSRAGATEAQYRVHSPPICQSLPGPGDERGESQETTDWQSTLVWGVGVPNDFHIALSCPGDPASAQLAFVDRKGDGKTSLVRLKPSHAGSGATCRFCYLWEHHRVSTYRKASDDDVRRPWTMTMEPGTEARDWPYMPDGSSGD